MCRCLKMERKRVPIQKRIALVRERALRDLHDAAEVVRTRGRRVPDGVEFYLAPASAEVQARSQSNGDWQTLIDAGAIALPPGCGACISGWSRLGAKKARTATALTNRNFKGRMGDRDAFVYWRRLRSWAASALGRIHLRAQSFAEKSAGTTTRRPQRKPTADVIGADHGRFSIQRARSHLFIDKDNLNTDGIYGSKHTYPTT